MECLGVGEKRMETWGRPVQLVDILGVRMVTAYQCRRTPVKLSLSRGIVVQGQMPVGMKTSNDL